MRMRVGGSETEVRFCLKGGSGVSVQLVMDELIIIFVFAFFWPIALRRAAIGLKYFSEIRNRRVECSQSSYYTRVYCEMRGSIMGKGLRRVARNGHEITVTLSVYSPMHVPSVRVGQYFSPLSPGTSPHPQR